MDVKIISRKLDPRDVIIKLVDGSTVKGKINLHYDEIMIQRVSEIFTKVSDPFVTVFEATVEGKTGKVVIINKRNIAWVMPEGDKA
jgi:small nuclear ribonucleoprotein (snRNP)-like protein